MANLDFASAMAAVLRGDRVRRRDWNRPLYVEKRNIAELSNPIIVMVMVSGVVGPYTPSGCDMVAKDWAPAQPSTEP